MRFLFRDAVPSAVGTVEVGFTDGLPVFVEVSESRQSVLTELADATGVHPHVMHQQHGAEVHHVGDDDPGDDPLPRVDALTTCRHDVGLVVRAADCVPVLIGSTEGVVGAAHAGRRGMALGVVPRLVDRLVDLGATDLTAWIGPHICGGCYEVPPEMREEVAEIVPASYATTTWGTPSLDLGAGVRTQLAAAGVGDVREVGSCTREDPRWPSYRREGPASARLAGVVWWRR